MLVRAQSRISLTCGQILISRVVGLQLPHILLIFIIAGEECKEGTALIVVNFVIQFVNSFVRKEELFRGRTRCVGTFFKIIRRN